MNNNKQKELEKLIAKFDIFYDFLIKNGTSEILLDHAKEIAYNAYNKKSLTNLRRVSKELDIWLKEIPQEHQIELQQILKDKINEEITDKSLNKLAKVIAQGEINNNTEYELLLKRVEEIYDDETKVNEVDQLNSLLADYHRKTDNKLK